MRDRLRIALVGAGGIAQKHAEGLLAVPLAMITAVVDVRPERAAQLAQRVGATAYPTLEACLPHVDLVYVLTPPSLHRPLAVMALEAGKPVVVEKPLASTLEDGEAMAAAAQRTGVPLMTAFNMRFRPGFLRLKETVESGRLGKPITFWSQRLGMGVGRGENWRTTPGLLCGMSVESLSHDIDLIHWLLGDIVQVAAQVRESRSDLPGFDDNACIVLGLANGACAAIHASWSSHIPYNSRGLVGEQGTALVTGRGLWELTTFHLKTEAMAHEQIEVLDDRLDVSSYREEGRHFVECIAHGHAPSITGEDGLRALRVSHAILASQASGQSVALHHS
ncbi:MAG TPA: Gfo/Idh/MocA family oxidoreductase [Caldilineaceae bacterium]|nr:Gfo/Idh/MocA family oxidoreductase [Caldilineaceae bacterium]